MEERGGLVTERGPLGLRGAAGASRSRSSSAATASGRAPGSPTSPRRSARLAELRDLSEPERALAFVAALLGRASCAARDDEHLRARRGRQRLRADDEPRPRLGRLRARLRPPSEQHARRGRPAHRAARAGRADGEHDGAVRSRSTRDGVALAAGAAGGTRLRSALLQVVAGILDEGLEPQAAVDRPAPPPRRLARPSRAGLRPRDTGALESAGFEVRAWPDRHHYFGGVSAVTPNGAAGDPRRNGEARVV